MSEFLSDRCAVTVDYPASVLPLRHLGATQKRHMGLTVNAVCRLRRDRDARNTLPSARLGVEVKCSADLENIAFR